jgi:hypothetical protein
MNRKLIISALLTIFFLGGMTFGTVFAQDKPGKPVIHESFASKEISPYETWKIYLKASDPDGNMKNIYAVVEQPGIGPYPLSVTRIKPENQKEFSGYVYLSAAGSDVSALNYVKVSLTVWIQDRSGNFSEAAVFSTTMNNRYRQEAPPAGRFSETDLGPIMVRLGTQYDSSKPWTID